MSSSISERYLRLHRTAVHPLFSILLPLLFLVSVDQLLRVLFPGIPWFPRHLAPLLLGAAVEEAVMGNLLFKERASFLARIRELCVLLALAFGYLFILLAVQSREGLRFSPILVYPMALILLQWLFSSGLHSGLREREILLSALMGRGGANLRHTLRDSSYQAGLTIRVLHGIKAALIVFQVLIVTLLITAALLKRQPTLASGLVTALHAMGGVLAIGLIHSFEEEQLLLGSGVPVPLRYERRRILFSVSILAIAAALVALAARNASLLPLSALIALLRKLASLFRFPAGRGMAEALQKTLLERQRYYNAMLAPQPPPVVSPLALFLVELLRRLFITLLGTGLFLFIVSPLLSQDFVDRLRELQPFAALRKKLRAFLRFSARLWLRLLHWLRLSRRAALLAVEDEEHRGRASRRRKAHSSRLSVRKRMQMSRVQRAFAMLLRWGEELGVPYLFFYSPEEYANRLITVVPTGAGQLYYVVEVFEEVIFSTHLVAFARISQYFRTIRLLRRLTPGAAGEAGGKLR
ncbi:MAG: hypothetical protein JSV89_07265 [Spirochaetaceae bacterium]|nr:MAG: hypothetical protein JSV89_07265 [Spirochaetaceae bacterium]